MSGYPRGPLQSVLDRHKVLSLGGKVSLAFGLLSGAWVLYEWYIFATSHEVIAFLSGITILLGTQLLIFASMTSMLISLYQESRART